MIGRVEKDLHSMFIALLFTGMEECGAALTVSTNVQLWENAAAGILRWLLRGIFSK